jgi:hypothetical protein
LRDDRGVDDGVAVIAGLVRGVGDGFGGAMVRVRVEGPLYGSVVELLLFWATTTTAQKQTTEAATKSFLMIGFLQA